VAKKTKNLGIRTTVERQKELRQLALDRSTTVQALYDRAIEAYLGIGQPTTAHSPARNEQASTDPNQSDKETLPSISVKDHAQTGIVTNGLQAESGIISGFPLELKEWFELLQRILTSGVPQVVHAIKSNLVAFDLIIQSVESSLGESRSNRTGTATDNQHERMDRILAHAQAIERDIETAERLIREARSPKQRGRSSAKRSGK
jgi:hypothetical protein